MRKGLRTMGTIGLTLLAAAAAGVVLGAAVVYSGIYDISATRQHTGPVYWLLDFAMRRSVKLRSNAVEVPPLDDRRRIENGFALYRAACVQCHGAPGIAPETMAMGLLPAPASLVATAREWAPQEIFQVVKHGIKMSGMPAWQYRMSDEDIWDVVAFMQVLPTLSPGAYAAWNRSTVPPAPQAAVPVQQSGPGNPEAGRRALQQYLCATCHRIPGIVGSTRDVGPPLHGIATRQYIAGVLPNTPDNLVQWLRHPTQIDPLTAMPDLGVSEQDARDIAAFLYQQE